MPNDTMNDTLSQRMVELERLTRINAQMLAAITHDLRAPLAALLLNAELLLRRGELGGLHGAGERIKAATAIMSKQVDHLVNLAQLPSHMVQPQLVMGDLACTVEACLQAAADLSLSPAPIAWHMDGDGRAAFDPALMREALDHLVLQALTYAGEVPVAVALDGSARRTLTWRISYPLSLPETARGYLLGDTGMLSEGDLQPRVGVGLRRAEEIARAHGGSIVGYSGAKVGTLFELMLPRDLSLLAD